MNWKTIFNPFEKFDEKHILALGILFFVINIFACLYAGMINDSIFHLSTLDEGQTIWDVIKINLSSYIFAIIILMILALIINKRTRFIDIINTVLISQIPLIISIPMMELPFFRAALSRLARAEGNPANVEILDMTIVTVGAFATLPLLVYSFVLYFNGFKTATNIKQWQQIVAFVIVSFLIITISQAVL